MKRLAFLVSGTMLTLALALSPSAWAQSRPHSGGGGGGGGQAVPRGSSGGGGGSVSGGGSSSSGSSVAPMPSGGSSSGAVSRPGGSRVRSGGASSLGSGGQRGEAVPRGSRPNAGGPTTGQAVPRTGRPPSTGGGGGSYYPGYYWGSNYYRSPYWGYGGYSGWGLGLYAYNPFWWGYGYPYSSYWGWDPYMDYYGYGFGQLYPGNYGGSYASPDSAGDQDLPDGALKLKIQPRDAEVYVDGYFVGQVDSFDGAFQHLDLEPGTHRVEVRAPGHETITFEVKIAPRQNVTYKGELKKAM